MPLTLHNYTEQSRGWPQSGRCLLAQWTEAVVVVYQAYHPGIGNWAARHGRFGGGGFKFERMSWIKPGFLWMMYRSGWASKEGQEVVLAVYLKRQGFEAILREAVPSTFAPALYSSDLEWRRALSESQVRMQWDPDHDPSGLPLARRAIQLGLRSEFLKRYAGEWIVAIEDITPFVWEQAEIVRAGSLSRLSTPRESEYPLQDDLATRIGFLSLPGRESPSTIEGTGTDHRSASGRCGSCR
ncbi:MAG TPA: DUF4291 domain-containing protein [Armatimonadota bacterium]|nr:DUF4291 domain-containing protein [Armatimonadota bacterium]